MNDNRPLTQLFICRYKAYTLFRWGYSSY